MIRIHHTLIATILLAGLLGCTPSAPRVGLSATPSSLEEGQKVVLKASVATGLAISKVEFYQVPNVPMQIHHSQTSASTILGEVSSPPYELEVKASILEPGREQNFSARVYTRDGQNTTSTLVPVKVQPDQTPPQVSLNTSSPSLNSAGNLTLSASASDANGVVKVEFYRTKGSSLSKLGEDTTPADGFNLMVGVGAEDNGAASYSAKAYDARGNVGSAEVSVQVDIDATAPTIALYTDKAKVTTVGPVTLTAVASDNKGITKVEFYLVQNGELQKLAEDTQAPYTYQRHFDATHNGNYVYDAKAYDAQGNITSPGPLSIVVDIDSTKPSVSLSADKTSVASPGSVTLSADASDTNGIAKVEFYQGSNKIGEDSEAPFTHLLSFNADHNGMHTYTATAYDAKGNFTTSSPLSITVDIDITNPSISLAADQTSLTQPGPALLTATVGDNKGVARVEFYVQSTGDSTKLGEDTEAPFTHELNFTAAHNGTHRYSARAYDAAGNTAESEPVSIEVLIDASDPVVSLSANPTRLDAKGSITLSADATDNIGVSKVEFFKNGEKIGEDTTAAGGFSWVVGYEQSYSAPDRFSAKAHDNQGNIATSNTVEVEIDIDVDAPTLTLSADALNLSQPTTVNLTAESDDNQKVTRLEFYRVWEGGEDQLLDPVFTDPFPSELIGVELGVNDNGSVTFYAKAYDAKGNVTTSNQENVVVAIKPSISQFGVMRGNLELGDSGGIVSFQWAGQYVQNYNLEVSPGDATATIPNLNNPIGTVVVPANTTNQVKTYTVTLKAKAYGNAGIPDDVRTLNITVAADSTAPTVSLSMEPPGPVTQEEESVSLMVSADDAAGIQKVEFYKSGNPTPFATDTSGPYETSTQAFTAADNGIHTYFARAYDINSNYRDSDPVSVSVEIWGSLNVSISGLSNGANGLVNIAGPDGYRQTISASTTLNNLKPGTYFLTPGEVDGGDFSYSAAVARAVVSNGNTASATITYAALNGALTVNISGLPSGQDVTVTGPNKFFRSISATTTFQKLEPGSYTVSAGHVAGYIESVVGSPATVEVGQTAVASVSYAVFSWVKVVGGYYHSCGIGSGGTPYCWGWNAYGQLGNGNTDNSTTPQAVSLPLGVASFSQLTAGYYHTCGIGSDGKAYCWGNNFYGQLGNGTTSSSNTPQAVSLPVGVTGFSQVGVGYYHTCGLGSDGKAYCWGFNIHGQLGNGNTGNSTTPQAVSLPTGVTSFRQLTTGDNHTCGIGSDGKAYCWGNNSAGQLGNGNTSKSSTPQAVSLSLEISQLGAGSNYTCGIGSDGKAYCWGYNGSGQLGNGTTSSSNTPQAVSLSMVVSQLWTRGDHTCDLDSDGKAYCWGWNFYGQLGNGNTSDSTTPQAVSLPTGVTGFSQLGTGFHHTCGVGLDGKAYCWGYNNAGQLGNSSNSNSITPVQVRAP